MKLFFINSRKKSVKILNFKIFNKKLVEPNFLVHNFFLRKAIRVPIVKIFLYTTLKHLYCSNLMFKN